MPESSKAIYAGLAANLAVAGTKVTAAAFTGSSAMFTEGLHSIVDSANELLLLLGKKRSKLPADEAHPFGHGQELYFWALIVSLLIFAAGGAVSVYEGILKLLHPQPPEGSIWNYVVLLAAALFEGSSLYVGVKQFRETYPLQEFWSVLRSSKDPVLFTVILENIADLAGLAVAFVGLLLADLLARSVYDGAAAVVIGAILMLVAVVLVRETKGLLTGESVEPEMRRRIRTILQSDPAVQSVNTPLTMHFGPENVLLAVEIEFRGGLSTLAIASTIDRLESAVRAQYPIVNRIFIEAESIGSASRQG
jgi:cation diffusion facilitator family transporter